MNTRHLMMPCALLFAFPALSWGDELPAQIPEEKPDYPISAAVARFALPPFIKQQIVRGQTTLDRETIR